MAGFSCPRFPKQIPLGVRGASVTDYLLITAIVAGVGFPIVYTFFGGPILETLERNRQTMVSFIAQDRKQSVPNSWFSSERVVDPGGDGEVDGAGEIRVGEVTGAGEVPGAGNIEVGELKGPGPLVGRGAGGGPGGFVPEGGGEPRGSSDVSGDSIAEGSSSLGSSFFKKESGKSGKEESDAGGEGGGLYGSSSGGESSSAKARLESEDPKQKPGLDKDESGQRGVSESKRSKEELLAFEEASERIKRTPFNWWFLLKILVLLLIIFFLILILLGNLRRR